MALKAWRSPSAAAARVMWPALACALVLAVSPAVLAQPTFPTTGYGTFLLDDEEPSVPDRIDIAKVGYQKDSTYAYFRIQVAGEASFASDRFILYFDLNANGTSDRRLLNSSATGALLETWDGEQWDKQQDGTNGWCLDPNDTPDDHVYFACKLSDINGGNFAVTAAAADVPSADDDQIHEPWNNPNFDEVTGSSVNPTAVEAADFCAAREGNAVRLAWRACAPALIAGFNVYLDPGDEPRRQVNPQPLAPTSDGNHALLDADPGPGVYVLEVVRPDGDSHIVAAVVAPSR